MEQKYILSFVIYTLRLPHTVYTQASYERPICFFLDKGQHVNLPRVNDALQESYCEASFGWTRLCVVTFRYRNKQMSKNETSRFEYLDEMECMLNDVI